MTDYISISSWGLFPTPASTHPRSFRIDEPEVKAAKIRQFKQGYFSGSEKRGVIVDRKE